MTSALMGEIANAVLYRLRSVPILSPMLRSMLSFVLPTGGPRLVRVLSGPFRGQLLLVDLQCERYYWLGTHEPSLQKTLRLLVKPGMIVYDVGAHAGFFSVALAHLTTIQGRVYAFEPYAPNFARLQGAIKANRLTNLQAIPFAVSSASGVWQFKPSPSTFQGKLIQDGAVLGTDTTAIATVSLDAFSYEQGHPAPDLIKIDVEGIEGEVLKGAQLLLQRNNPILVLEVHDQEQASVVRAILREAQYVIRPLGALQMSFSQDTFGPGHYVAQPCSVAETGP